MKCCCFCGVPDTALADFWHYGCVFFYCLPPAQSQYYLPPVGNKWSERSLADLLQQIWFEFYSRAVSFGAQKMLFVRGVVFCSVLWNGLVISDPHTGDGQYMWILPHKKPLPRLTSCYTCTANSKKCEQCWFMLFIMKFTPDEMYIMINWSFIQHRRMFDD